MYKPTFIKNFLAVCFVMLLFTPASNGDQPGEEGLGQVRAKKFDLESYKMLMPLIKEQMTSIWKRRLRLYVKEI